MLAPQVAHAELTVVEYRFAGCELNLMTRQLSVEGRLRPLEPKTFEVLAHLIARRHRVVARQELHDALWQGRAICDGALAQCIWTVRKALGTVPGGKDLIKTLNGVGYRFVGEVVEVTAEERDWRLAATVARLGLARALLRSPRAEDHATARALTRQCQEDGEDLGLPWLLEATGDLLNGAPRLPAESSTQLRAVRA